MKIFDFFKFNSMEYLSWMKESAEISLEHISESLAVKGWKLAMEERGVLK